MNKTTYRAVHVDGTKVFYREAGSKESPAILLLHGFPSASHMFRDLIPMLSAQYHVVAPDYPGFGQSDMPPRDTFSYTFANLASVIARFTEVIGLERFAIYIFDYGAPVGLGIALKDPKKITGIISQNGNAYLEGISAAVDPIRNYSKEQSAANKTAVMGLLKPETTVFQYTQGAPDKALVSPDGYSLDNFYLARPGADDVQLDFFKDYNTAVGTFPQVQQYFRDRKPPLLAIWGKNDPFFVPAGAQAFKRDLPDADIRFVDGGHFAIETCADAIASAIMEFMNMAVMVR
jgi:pimeloyl-ACP methyl ester carboxylesterase